MLLKDSNLKYAAGILALFVVICFKMSVFGFELLFAVLLLLALDFRLNDYISVKFSKIIIYFSDMSFCIYLTHTILYFYLIANGKFGIASRKGFVLGCVGSILLSWISWKSKSVYFRYTFRTASLMQLI